MSLLPDNLEELAPSQCTARESTLGGARALLLDNGVLRLSVLPELGGRICSLFYRPLNQELLATEFISTGGMRGLTARGGWCAAFPSLLADGEALSHQVWEAEIVEQSAARVTARLWCRVDRLAHQVGGALQTALGHIDVERFIRLELGKPAVTVEDVLLNRGSWPAPTTWSAMVSLKAHPGDRAILPTDRVEVQRGVGPDGNELDFGLLVSTPYQAMARFLREGWLGFRPVGAPVDVRLSFPLSLLPHAVIIAQRNEQRPAEDAFRFQPLATTGPVAESTRGGALVLPVDEPVRLPLTMEIGVGLLNAGAWSRPGLQLAQMIDAQRVPAGRVVVWRVGEQALVVKTPRYLLLLLPEYGEDALLTPEDLPNADLILCAEPPEVDALRRMAQRTTSRFIGPPLLRQLLLAEGMGSDRSVALSPGARFDLPGLGILATPARSGVAEERLGFLLLADNISLYHAGPTEFLGEFGPIGEQFHPQFVFLPTSGAMTLADAVHAARQLQPRVVSPLGPDDTQQDFIQRCRAQHFVFAAQALYLAEGVLFDGYHLHPLGKDEGENTR